MIIGYMNQFQAFLNIFLNSISILVFQDNDLFRDFFICSILPSNKRVAEQDPPSRIKISNNSTHNQTL